MFELSFIVMFWCEGGEGVVDNSLYISTTTEVVIIILVHNGSILH